MAIQTPVRAPAFRSRNTPSPMKGIVVTGTPLVGLLTGCGASASSSLPPTGTPTATATPTATPTPAPTATDVPPVPVATAPPTALPVPTMPGVVHCYLDSAVAKLQTVGVSIANIAFTTLGENSVVLLESNWIVLTESPAANAALGAGIVHLGVVKLTDPKAAGITPLSCA
jgi:hypothetical protein